MKKFNALECGLVMMNETECIASRGGAGDWDKQVVTYVGMGVGYGVKKLWRAFQFLSSNLYKLQGQTQVIYK
ncbi:MAG: hypothetical protein CVT93_06020 [Bacteroidetes bacterium HGW-Bacteroidetes-10]|jgi:hypothetical protein|nr:MAG: hypothetical protein CVT93_06020 [Bacteroidetes bacterium HGW-Bacteroidetes-10]